MASKEKDDPILFELQERYKNGDQTALGLMYSKLFEVAYKNINSRSCTNQNLKAMSAEERKQKAHDAATYLIEQLIKRPGFEFEKSITGYLYLRITWELNGRWHQNKRDQMVTYTDELPQIATDKKRYTYIVTDLNTGEAVSYASAAELYLNPAFKGLRKKRLVESLKTGRTWKNYFFDILEVDE